MSYPYFRFFPGDYLRDTRQLSLIQHGAYMLLLMHYYASGKPLPDDLDELCRIVGTRTRHERAAVLEVRNRFFTLKDGSRNHKRVAAELSTMSQRSQQATDKAKKRWSSSNANAYAPAMQQQCKPDVDLDIYNPRVKVTPTVEASSPKPSIERKGNGKTDYPRDAIWDRDDALTDAKGRELGIAARPGELYPEYRMRLHAAIAEQRRK